MDLTRTILLGAAMVLAIANAQAADDRQARDVPGFNEMDKDDDGALSRSEAAANPGLVAGFGEVDDNDDGKVSRYEYMKRMAVEDFTRLRETIAGWMKPDESGAAGGTKAQR